MGSDLFMRSNSRFAEEPTILKTRVDTPAVRGALAGESGVASIADYRDVPVLSAYAPLEFQGATWAVLAEIDEAEVLEPLRALRNFLIGTTAAAILVVGAGLGVLLSRPLSRR